MLQKKLTVALATTLAAAVLAGCGGSSSSAGNQAPKHQFTSAVVFGDSLSDVGTYDVGTIQLAGGGRYTVNAFNTDGSPVKSNWTELVSAQLGLAAPCPAVTGLDGVAQYGFDVPVTTFASCTSYAMGGAMVTFPYGPGNAQQPGGSPLLGQLTYPIVQQMQNHLAAHTYSGNEVVFILAGGNDGIVNTEVFAGTVAAAEAQGGAAAAAAAAQTAGPAAVQAMGQAATELAGYINQYVVGQGAKYVVVLSLPDLSTTPFGYAVDAELPGTQALVKSMVTTFNSTLQQGLTSPNVLYVDLQGVSADQVANPAQYGLTNATAPACNLNQPANILASSSPDSGSSLVCNATNVIAGDISHYEFADMVHPTPYGNVLLARYVAAQMAIKGWL